MALIVEDGTGLADAESYLSVADADTYHADRNNEAWQDYSTAEKEAALRKATQYITGDGVASFRARCSRCPKLFVGRALTRCGRMIFPCRSGTLRQSLR